MVMRINAMMQHKASEFETQSCEVEKIVELPRHEFLSLLNSPLSDRDFITENAGLMGRSSDGVYHCVLALGEGCDDGLLIEAEGYDYARLSAFVPNARQIINTGQYQCLADIGKQLSDAADEVISRANAYEYEQPYRVLISDLAETHGLNEAYAPLLTEMLNEHGQAGAMECELINDEIFIYKPEPVKQYDPVPFEPERAKHLLDKALDWIGKLEIGAELYDTLRKEIGMTDEEISSAGFVFDAQNDELDETSELSLTME